MRGLEFKRLARQGVKSYGDDPWFFLRELAQNSRDAGARHIRVSVLSDGDREGLTFADDGRGMGREHAEQFLFRLYASSKESERSSAGMFGIGFWTVLGFEPDNIEVMSRTETESWALNLDHEFTVHETTCELDEPGTRVVLSRPAALPDRGAFRDEVRSALHRYCRYLRRNDRASSVLPVDLDGAKINEPLRVGGPTELRFRSGAVEGAVGLADEPRVELYARGLPVWEGMLLEELSHNPPPIQSTSGLETGLSPVFVLNGNDLDVVMDRNAVVDDRALRRLRRRAAGALRRLVREQIDGLPGRGLFPRLRRLFAQLRSRRWAGPALGALVLAAVVGLFFMWEGLPEGRPDMSLWEGLSSPDIGPGEGLPQLRRAPLNDLVSLQQALASYRGAVVELSTHDAHLPLTYTPPVRAWFRFSVAEDFDQRLGFVRTRIPADGPPPTALDCQDACVRVRVPTRGGDAVPLPLPTGWTLVTDSLALDGHPLPRPAALNRYGEAVVHLPAGGGVLTWACTPHRSSLGDAATARLLETGGAPLPAALEEGLRGLDGLPPEARVVRALALTRSLLSYVEGDGPQAPRPGDQPWADRALALGTGDCDVINGILVLAMRRLGIPARLAIGFVGDEGRLRPGLHAWTEFHLGGWQAVDASSAAAVIAAEAEEIVVEVPPIRDRSVPPYPRPLLVASPRPLRPSATSPMKGEEGQTTSVLAGTMDTTTPLYSSPQRGGSAPKGRGGVGEATNPLPNILIIIAIAATLAALILLLVHLRRARTWSRLEGDQSPEAADAVLGRMALSWSVRPDLWGVAGFSLAPLLPRLGGGRISLERAAFLAHRGRLFFGSPDNPLALSPRGGVVVLDGSNPGFAPYLHRIPSALDLDPIHAARPADPASREGPVPDLLAAVNQVLDGLGEGRARCLLAPGLGAGALRDVDLGGLGARHGLPPRFIAIDPGAPFIREAGRLHNEQPILAVYRMIEWISHRSALPTHSPAQLRRGAARLLLGARS